MWCEHVLRVVLACHVWSWCLLAGFVTSLLSDKTQLSRLATSWDSALDLAQQAGLNLAAISSSLEEARVSELNAQLQAQAELTQKLLRLPAGSSAVVTNGRAVVVNSPALGLSDEFTKEDFGLLVGPALVYLRWKEVIKPRKGNGLSHLHSAREQSKTSVTKTLMSAQMPD